MKKFTLLFVFIIISRCLAFNDLSLKVPGNLISKQGYIDNATLVVQPFGGTLEQSLYLEYSDHNQFSYGQQVEIIHRFELPQGSVVNDLWLWIGKEVMKARVIDTWTARSIYDSIVSMKRDPAFLSKNGNQYELHIYPLTPGSIRKIKINFITPAQYLSGEVVAPFPLAMLNASGNSPQHLKVLYRTTADIWGVPRIKEFPSAVFTPFSDTLGFDYKQHIIDNIKPLSTLRFSYNFNFSEAAYFTSNETDSTQRYFQFLFSAKDAFGLRIDSTSKNVLFTLDLSGDHDKTPSVLQNRLQLLLKSALKENDKFNMLVAGCGRIEKIFPSYVSADSQSISLAISSFINSIIFDSISHISKKYLTFGDYNSSLEWGFQGIDSLATISNFTQIYDAVSYIPKSSIVTSYDQGYENPPTTTQLTKIWAALDTMFIKGGRFVTYYDFNRDQYEKIATHYISGLKTLKNNHDNTTLYRNTNGNIGSDFPETIDHAGTYFLTYNDPAVQIELRDQSGAPAVISKKIGNGLIVVSGLWEFNDDRGLKKMINMPLLGLTKSTSYQQLISLYNSLKPEFQQEPFQKVFMISNGDSLITSNGAGIWADWYLGSFGGTRPSFSSINLLSGSEFIPPTTSYNGNIYYGSGLLMYLVSQGGGGAHFESYNNDIYTICSGLSPYSIPSLGPIQFTVKADNSTSLINDFYEVHLEPNIQSNPQLFVGSTTGKMEIQFDIASKLLVNNAPLSWSTSFSLSHDTTKGEPVISSMIGNEKIKNLFNINPVDTAQIVALAIKHNLLCNFSAMLALEPNETIHFMKDPFDESGLLSVKDDIKSDSVSCSIYPNPFNLSTRIMVNLLNQSKLQIEIYDILGRRISTITDGEEAKGIKTYSWNGRNSFGATVTTGVYLVHCAINDKATNQQTLITKKIMLLK